MGDTSPRFSVKGLNESCRVFQVYFLFNDIKQNFLKHLNLNFVDVKLLFCSRVY